MPDIDFTKEDTRTSIILLQQKIEELIKDFQEFKAEDKEWKDSYKQDKEQENIRLQRLEEFMIKKITENGYLKDQTIHDKEQIKQCNARFEHYDEACHWIESYKKFFWLVLSVFVTSIITNFLSLFDVILKK